MTTPIYAPRAAESSAAAASAASVAALVAGPRTREELAEILHLTPKGATEAAARAAIILAPLGWEIVAETIPGRGRAILYTLRRMEGEE